MVIVWLTFVVLLCVKAPDALTAAQFWAEDASVFFAEQWASRTPQILAPYAGYLHVVPRLVAWALSEMPSVTAPLAYNVAAILLAGSALTYAALRLEPEVRWWWLALAVLVLPTAGDVFGSLTNVQWFGQFCIAAATFRARDGDQPTPGGASLRAVAGCLVLLAWSLSGPFSVLWMATLGLFLAYSLVRGGAAAMRRAVSVMRPACLVTIALGALIQGSVLLGQTVGTPEAQSNLSAAAYWSLVPNAKAQPHPYSVIVNAPWTPAHLALLAAYGVGILWIGFSCRHGVTRVRLHLALLATFGLFQPLLAFVKQQAPHTLAAPSHYFMALGVAIILCVGHQASDRAQGNRVALFLILAAACLFVLRPEYIRRAPLQDLEWQRWSAELNASQGCTVVPVNPPRWHARIPPRGSMLDCSPGLPGSPR